MSAPMGAAHGKAKVPFSEVERVRDMREFMNLGYKRIAAITGYNVRTIRDWTNYRTRTHG